MGPKHLCILLLKGEGERERERMRGLVRINWNYPPLLNSYAEGTLDSIITASEKSTTTTKSEDVEPNQAQPSVEQDVANREEPEAVDIDLSDPEVQKAASAIQARFRSHLKRGEAKKSQEQIQPVVVDDKETLEQTQNELSSLDLDDPELNKAASVIQSNFRIYLSEKNKATEEAETQKESEGAGDTDTEQATSPCDTEDPDLMKAESTTDKITTETEESNIDEQVPPPPAPAEAQDETEGKDESIPEPSSSELESQEKVEKEGDSKEALQSEPVADEEPQPAETEGEGATSIEEEEPGASESEELPETAEETKGDEKSGGDDGTSNGGDGGGVEEGPADKDTAVTVATEQAEATAGNGEKQEEGAPEVCIRVSVMIL